jgi:hypothetical protein
VKNNGVISISCGRSIKIEKHSLIFKNITTAKGQKFDAGISQKN